MGGTDRKAGPLRSLAARSLKLGPYGVCTGASDRGRTAFPNEFWNSAQKACSIFDTLTYASPSFFDIIPGNKNFSSRCSEFPHRWFCF